MLSWPMKNEYKTVNNQSEDTTVRNIQIVLRILHVNLIHYQRRVTDLSLCYVGPLD